MSEQRKIKRNANQKATNLLVIPKKDYIGKYYNNGIKLEITTEHAVISRAAGISIFPNDTANYHMLRYIYDLSVMKERTEDQELELKGGDIFIAGFTYFDFAGNNIEKHQKFSSAYLEVLADELEHITKEEAKNIIANSLGYIHENSESDINIQQEEESGLNDTK